MMWQLRLYELAMSLPAWGVRVEIGTSVKWRCPPWSLPAWGVRVEIDPKRIAKGLAVVTPRMGSAG